MKLFGIFCFSILTSLIFFGISQISGSKFMESFLKEQSLTIATTLIGFNIAVHTILVGQISTLENLIKKVGFFQQTRKELKHNAIFSVFLIGLIFLLQNIRIEDGGYLFLVINIKIINSINRYIDITVLTALVLIIFLIIETINSVYKIYQFEEKK